MSDHPSSGSEAELALTQEAFRDATQGRDPFTFESGVPVEFDIDYDTDLGPYCSDCRCYHRGECW